MIKESTLQIQCVEYLTILAQQHEDLIFFSIPNEGLMFALMSFKIPKKIIAGIVKHFKKMGLLSGVPDFLILFNKKAYFIEFKRPGKTPTDKQVRIIQKIFKAGFPTCVIDNFDQFRDYLDYVLTN